MLHVAQPKVFTVSVGGLEAGGSGKTPVTALLLRALQRAGKHPGLLSRGYGRRARGLVLRRPGTPAPPAAIGDEPAMLVRQGIDIPLVACAWRRSGAAVLASLGCDALVLDDGFAHRKLARHLDIVVLRGEAPFGRGHLLPWGALREPPSSLRRAHVVWLHYRSGVLGEVPARLAQMGAAIVCSVAAPGDVRDAAGHAVVLRGKRVVAAAGIARPADFFAAASARGANVVATVALRDHHRYLPRDVRRLQSLLVARRAEALLVTAKDAVKLAPLWPGDDLWVLETQVVIRSGVEELAQRLKIPAAALDVRTDAAPSVS